ncbi:hypothetical protein A2U01_0038891, partial [Trifolium medium]|nr:hypothetical protein [Trifolium medium]
HGGGLGGLFAGAAAAYGAHRLSHGHGGYHHGYGYGHGKYKHGKFGKRWKHG